jgi:DNA-directed RNA polymerase sigma subunit (sigma70/sigma32)
MFAAPDQRTVEAVDARRQLRVLDHLDERSRDVLFGLYVLEESCVDLAKRHGVTRQRIYQIKEAALNELRNSD